MTQESAPCLICGIAQRRHRCTHIDRRKQTSVFFSNYQKRSNLPIITTGNELVKEQLTDFSKPLHLKALYAYAFRVKGSTEKFLRRLSYDALKKSMIDSWCKKKIRGFIQMPFSRHWILHTEAGLRIKNKLHP